MVQRTVPQLLQASYDQPSRMVKNTQNILQTSLILLRTCKICIKKLTGNLGITDSLI